MHANARQLHLWCLYDGGKKRVIEGLLFDEARAIIGSLDSEVLDQWWAWRDDWADWKKVSEIEGITEMIYRASPAKHPEIPDQSLSDLRKEAPQGLDPNTIPSLRIADGEEPVAGTAVEDVADISNVTFTVRDKRRFKKRYQVSIKLGSNVFNSFTRDISVGGLNLEDALPEWVTGQFKVRIGKPNNKKLIELKCCLVEGDEDRHRIKILPLQRIEDEKALEAWIAA